MSATISVQNLRKSYGSMVAVGGISFEVEQGEFFGILGPNGAGKTTTLEMLEGLREPDDGHLTVLGLPPWPRNPALLPRIGVQLQSSSFFGILGPNGAGKTTTLEMLEGLREPDDGHLTVLGLPPWPRNPALLPRIGVQLQSSSFFERLTAREQIRTFASLYRVSTRRADEMLGIVGLDEQAETKAEKLSGGQAQRLSIACALVHDPELVFMDEPTGALDPQARRNLWDLLRQINADGRTVVLTTHHMDEAETLCDRVAIMDHGQILKLGAPAALVRGLDTPLRISVESGLLTAADARALTPAAEVGDDGVSLTIATRDPAAVLAGLADRRALAGLRVQGATLEDVFLTLTGREYRA